jgi:Transposase and inactivated derivatives
MFRKEENLCEKILRETAKEHRIEIVEIFVMPDHVHLIVGILPTMS